MQADIHHHLVEGALKEGRVDSQHRSHSGHRQAGRECDGVLLGDADVEEAVGETFGERSQAGTAAHGRGDGDQARLAFRLLDQRLAKDVRVGHLPAQRLGRQQVEGTDAVQMIDLVLFGRPVAAPLRGDDVHHRRTLEPADLSQRPLDVLDVVAVDRSRVFDPEILEEGARRDQLFEALLHSPASFDRLVAGRKGA